MTIVERPLSYVVGEKLPGPYKSCVERFQENVHRYPENIAAVCAHQAPDLYQLKSTPLETSNYAESPYLRLSYRELWLTVERLAQSFVTMGIGPGIPVFTFVQNGIEYLTIFWASMRVGSTLIPISIRNLTNTSEVTHMLNTAIFECPGKEPIVFVDSSDTAYRVDSLPELASARRFVVGTKDWQSWNAFSSLLQDPKLDQLLPEYAAIAGNDKDSIILFTSGTTNLPKACRWHYPGMSFFAAFRDHMGDRFDLKIGDVFACSPPNNHGLSSVHITWCLSSGATFVFTGPSFDPVAFLKVATEERCTHTITVPTMVHLIASAGDTQELKMDHLKCVMLGGAVVTPEVLKLCTDALGSRTCENGYGMTEGAFVFTGRCSPEELIGPNGETTVGRVLPETRLKICAPGSRMPVPWGEVGELHSTGPTVCDGYINKISDDFYEEDGLRWCATGDTARLDSEGRVYIIGRYKEMIIRGAENISPVAIETVINRQLPHLQSLLLQVVGAPDEIAGEVPVAVAIRNPSNETVKEIKDTVVANMGQMYAIDDVIFIEDLGLKDYPRTPIGKVQRLKLKALIEQYRKQDQHRNGFTNSDVDARLVEQVKATWGRVIGVSPSEISHNTSLGDTGDSITLMRTRDRLFKQTGIELNAQEMMTSETIGGLIHLMSRKSATASAPGALDSKSSERAPNVEHLAFALDDQDAFETTKTLITRAIKDVGLRWEDVRDVMPSLDWTEVWAKRRIYDVYTIKGSLLARKSSVETLREAVIQAAANNPMMASFILCDEASFDNDLAVQFTVDPRPDFLLRLVEDAGTLPTLADLKQRTFEMMKVQGAPYPGPLLRVWLYYIEETKCAGLIHNIAHTVTDQSFIQLFWEDIDHALSGSKLKPHVPYKIYCDHVYTLRTSPSARAATKYHVQKLKDLHKHTAHFWPALERPLQVEDGKPDGYAHTFQARALNDLIQKHPDLKPSVIMKAATALFLLDVSNHSHAMFAYWDSCRDRFPFITSSSLHSQDLKASDVGGQLIQPVFNLISLLPGETTLQFLVRLQDEQTLQSKHAVAPYKEIMRSLDTKTAEILPELSSATMFNWLGTNVLGRNAFRSIEVVNAVNRTDVHRFIANTSLVRDGKGNDEVLVHVKSSVYSIAEQEGFARKIERAAVWIIGNLHEAVEKFRASI